MLGYGDGVGITVTPDLDAQHPVQLAEVGDLDVAAEPSLELIHEAHSAGSYGTIVDVYGNNDKLLDLGKEFEEDCLVNS